jgi:UDP-N-acetylmuramate dehydrogenase
MAAPIERICEGLDAQVTLSAPLAKHTWFGVGGGCDALVQPRSEAALSTLLRRCAEADIPVRVLGQGANLLVSDEGVDGVVLKLDQPCFSGWQIRAHGDAELVQAGGGSDMARVMHAWSRSSSCSFHCNGVWKSRGRKSKYRRHSLSAYAT